MSENVKIRIFTLGNPRFMRCKVLDSVQVTGKYGQKGHSFGSTSKTKFQESASLISHRLSLFHSCTEYLNVLSICLLNTVKKTKRYNEIKEVSSQRLMLLVLLIYAE